MEQLSPSSFFDIGSQLLTDKRPLAGPSQSEVDELMRHYAAEESQQPGRPFESQNDFLGLEAMFGHAGGVAGSLNMLANDIRSSPLDDDILKRYLASPVESGASPLQPDNVTQAMEHAASHESSSRIASELAGSERAQAIPSGQPFTRPQAAVPQNASAGQPGLAGSTTDASALLGAIHALGDTGKQQLLAILSLAVSDKGTAANLSASAGADVKDGKVRQTAHKRSSERSQKHASSAVLTKQARQNGLLADSPGSASGASVASASASGSTGSGETPHNSGSGSGSGSANAMYFANAFSQFRPPSRDNVQVSASGLRHTTGRAELQGMHVRRSDAGNSANVFDGDKHRAALSASSADRRSAGNSSYHAASQQSSPVNANYEAQRVTETLDTTQLYRSPAIGTSSSAFYAESLGDDVDALFTPLMSPALTMSTQPGPSIGPLPESFANLGKDGFANSSVLKNALDQFSVVHQLSPLTSPALAPVPEHSTVDDSTFSRPASISSGRSHRGASKNVPKARPSPILRPVQTGGPSMGSQYSSPVLSPIGRTDRSTAGRNSGHSRAGSTSSLHATSMLLPPPASASAALGRDQNHHQVSGASSMHVGTQARQAPCVASSAPASPTYQSVEPRARSDPKHNGSHALWQDSPSPQQFDLTALTPAALTLLHSIQATTGALPHASSLSSSTCAYDQQIYDSEAARTASAVPSASQQQQINLGSGSVANVMANDYAEQAWPKPYDGTLDYDAILTMLGSTTASTTATLSAPSTASGSIPQHSSIHPLASSAGHSRQSSAHAPSGSAPFVYPQNMSPAYLPVDHSNLPTSQAFQPPRPGTVRPNDIVPPMTPSSFMNLPHRAVSNISAMPTTHSNLYKYTAPSSTMVAPSGDQQREPGKGTALDASSRPLDSQQQLSLRLEAAAGGYEVAEDQSTEVAQRQDVPPIKTKSATRKRSLSTTGKKVSTVPKRMSKKAAAAAAADAQLTTTPKHDTTLPSSSNISPIVLPDNRKSSHKIAEQRRRDSLKNCFEELRFILPPINPEEDEDFNTGNKRPGENNVGGQRSKGGMIDPRHPNKGISKVALLRKSNEYVSKLHERLDRRDAIIETLRAELRQCRVALKQADGDDVDAQDALSAVDWEQLAADTDVQPPPYRMSTSASPHKLQYAGSNGIIHEEDETQADQDLADSIMEVDGDVHNEDQSDLDMSGDYRSKRSKRRNSNTAKVDR